jgi:hypothetical protein
MGLKPIIATNKTTNVGTLTQTSFNTFSETAFRFGEDQKLFMCAPRILSAINNFSLGKINTYVDDKVFGLSLQRYIAPLGEYLLHNNFRLEAGITGGLGFDDEAYSVDLPSVGLRYLDGGESLIGDTKLYNDVQQDGTTVRQYSTSDPQEQFHLEHGNAKKSLCSYERWFDVYHTPKQKQNIRDGKLAERERALDEKATRLEKENNDLLSRIQKHKKPEVLTA